MKKEIHPKWYKDAKVSCACGHKFTVGATVPEIKVEICSHCHPFYTGEERLVDTAGRVEKFEKKMATAKERKRVTTKARRGQKREKEVEEKPKTLKEMLKGR